MARAGENVGAKFFFISSDYVFDGTKKVAYTETDEQNPLSVYGRTKMESENFLKSFSRSAWVIRTSWLFGTTGKSFFKSILNVVKRGDRLRVVTDQRGAPTYAPDLAGAFSILVEKTKRGEGGKIYHLTNSGETNWYDAAKRLLAKIQYKGEIAPITSEELNWAAKRPKNSILSNEQIGIDFGIRLRSWEMAFEEFWKTFLVKEWQNEIKPQFN